MNELQAAELGLYLRIETTTTMGKVKLLASDPGLQHTAHLTQSGTEARLESMDLRLEELHHALSRRVCGLFPAMKPLRQVVEVAIGPCGRYEHRRFRPLAVQEADKLVHIGLD